MEKNWAYFIIILIHEQEFKMHEFTICSGIFNGMKVRSMDYYSPYNDDVQGIKLGFPTD